MDMAPQTWPEWYDGRHINEVLFCQHFLEKHPNRLSSELAQNERLYNVEATNNVHVGGKRVRGFMGIEVVNPLPY